MLKKRLVGVITVKDGWAVQSFGYGRYLPLGRPQCLAENLDRWGADEILVLCIDRTRRGLGPDMDLLRQLGLLGLSTPLAYGGGVRSVAEAAAVIQSGAERVCIDALMRSPDVVRGISDLVGAQAVIGALPLSLERSVPHLLDYLTRSSVPLMEKDLTLFASRVISEALIIDWRNEGSPVAFDVGLIRRFPTPDVPIIAFGGISDAGQLEVLFEDERVTAAGVGNFLAYREHAVQRLKRQAAESSVRGASFSSESR